MKFVAMSACRKVLGLAVAAGLVGCVGPATTVPELPRRGAELPQRSEPDQTATGLVWADGESLRDRLVMEMRIQVELRTGHIGLMPAAGWQVEEKVPEVWRKAVAHLARAASVPTASASPP